MRIIFSFLSLFFLPISLLFSGIDEDYKIFNPMPVRLYSAWTSDPAFLEVDKAAVCRGQYADWEAPTRYFQYNFSRYALSLEEGDFIECGVYNRRSFDIFSLVLDLWDTQDRCIYGFDTFEGLPAPTSKDTDPTIHRQFFQEGGLHAWEKERIENLLAHHQCNFQLIQGLIPRVFSGYEDKNFCFAHIDVDLYQSTLDSIAFVYPRMLKGGIILFDDYGFPMCAGSKIAIDEYFSNKPEVVIALPTGQAFVIKQ